MAQNLTSDGAIEMDVGYSPTQSLDIVTVAYINSVIGAEALHPGPFALTVTIDLSGHAALAWTSSTNALNYQVYRDAAAYGSITSAAATAFDGGSLTPALTAEFSVRAWVSDTNDYYNTAIIPAVRQNAVLQSITWPLFDSPTLTPSTGPVATFSRAGDCTYFFGTEMRYELSGEPCYKNTVVVHNYASAPSAPATQTVDLQCGQYTVQVFGGTGTLTCTGNGATGTADVSTPLVIDVYANSSDKAAVVFSLGGAGATHMMISPGTVAPGYTTTIVRAPNPGERSMLRIFGGETELLSATTGLKGFNNFNPAGTLASNNRTSVLADRIQDGSRSYFALEATSTSAHGQSTNRTFSAGSYVAEWCVGKSSTRGYAFGIVDAGGAMWGFVDPSAGTVTVPALTQSTPAALNFATSAVGDVGSMFKFRTTWSISVSSTACTVVGRLLISLSAATIADMVYAGASLGVSHGQLGIKRDSNQVWLAQHPTQLGASRPAEIVTQTLTTEFNTSATTIFWRGQVHPGASGVRTIMSGNLWSLAVNGSDQVALAISSQVLTHANVIARGSDFSVACRIKSGAHYLQVDRGTPVSSGASAAPGATTTLRHGRDSADGAFLNGFMSYFQMVPTGYTDAQITQWALDQGTGLSGGSVPAAVRCKFNGTQAGHGLIILNQTVDGSAGLAKSQLNNLVGRGMTAIPHVTIGYMWKGFEPTTRDVYTWTDFDGIMSAAAAASKYVWVQIYTTNYHQQNKTVPAYIPASEIIWDSVATREETKMEHESVMTDFIRATAAFATRYRNNPWFMGFQHQEVAQARITQALAPDLFAQYRRWITTLAASFPELSFGGKYNSTRRELIELNCNAMITAKGGNFGWPDSPLPQLTDLSPPNFWQAFLVARDPAFNTKLIMAPSVQSQQIDATIATARTIRNTLISAMKAHIIFWSPNHQTTGNSYFEDVIRVVCQESATTNTADPFA